MVAQLLTSLSNLWSSTSPALIYQPIDVQFADQTSDYIQIQQGRHYVRLWAAQIYLANKTAFLASWFPAIHSLARFDSLDTRVSYPSVNDAGRAALSQSPTSGDVIGRNFALTPLIPFNGGTINLDAGLVAVQGANYLGNFITTLSDFSALLAVPQFSAALKVADPLSKGLQSLLSIGGLHLALNDTLTTGSLGGYRIALRATPQQVKPTDLRVRNSELRLANQFDGLLSNPLSGYDFMLFRIEVTEQGPDYRSLTTIQSAMSSAHQSLKEGEDLKADGYYRQAIIAAHEAAELTNADRSRVKRQLMDDYKQLKVDLGSGLVGGEYDLSESMRKAISVSTAMEQGEPSWGELFGS